MDNLKQILYIIPMLLIWQVARSQSDVHFIPEVGQQIDTSKQWYGVLSNLQVVHVNPYVKHITSEPGEEVEFEGMMIVEDQYPVLIFTPTDMRRTVDQFYLIDTISALSSDQRITIEPNISLISKTFRIDGDEVYSLFVLDELRNLEIEIFRNCRVIPGTENYFGCGRSPLFVEFIGDIVNDSTPEVLFGADKEAGALRVLIGKKDNEYQVIKWTEYVN